MKIAVCLKQVPDTETKIKISSDSSQIDTAGIKWIINPYDELAIEEALKTKQSNADSTVTAFCVGPKSRITEALRTALAMGCDEAVAIDDSEGLDSLGVAKTLSEAIKKEGASFHIVFSGKLAIDDNASSVGQMMAEFLGMPHVNSVSKLTLTPEKATAEKEVEGGSKEIIEVQLPAVIGANKGLNTPRYASLPGIMKAKKKTIKEYSASELGADPKSNHVNYTAFKAPPEKPSVKFIEGDVNSQAKELAQLLRNEAKVL